MRRLLKHAAGATLASTVAIGGCIDNAVNPRPDDASGTLDDSQVAESDSRPDACPEVPPGDQDVVLAATCAASPSDWSLREKWSWDAGDLDARRMHVGRFEDTDGDGWITSADEVGILLVDPGERPTLSPVFRLDGTGRLVEQSDPLIGATAYATVGDVDASRVGLEYVVTGFSSDEMACRTAAAAPGAGVLYNEPVAVSVDPSIGLFHPFLTDLDADGGAEVLTQLAVTSASDGRTLFTLPPQDTGVTRLVAADLDLDGYPEILTGQANDPVVIDHEGREIALCDIEEANDERNFSFAIGNLDGDPEGEFAVATGGVLAICESNGTVDKQVVTGSYGSWTLAIGELDGDDEPELVSDEYALEDVAPNVVAYDSQLNRLWRHSMPEGAGRANIALADLDGDGLHEILIHVGSGGLVILGPDGTQLASIDGTSTGGFDGPIVADIDGDGLAEILIAGEDPDLTVYANNAGGWPVVGAEDPWPASNHFPGDRNLDGSLPSEIPWLIPGRNVWQGLEPGPALLPDLGVALTDACSDDCVTTTVTAYVSNTGGADAPVPVTVELYRVEDGSLLGSVTLGDVPAGVKRPVQFSVPTADLGSGVRAVASSAWAECGDEPNEATLTELPCR